ncbi:MAG: zinc-dependent peptidase [Betaproteobacteria bacterium]|nr:zinc-dependent peptidase [Betaproteobacteria bacterium]
MLDKFKRWLALPDRQDMPIPDGLWACIETRLPFLAWLPDEARFRLRVLSKDFLAEKEFYGAQGFCLDDKIILTIAMQACLPILNHRGLATYHDWVGIVVYPGDFVVPQRIMDETGVVHEYEEVLLGEARADGPVLLAWFDNDPPAGVNIVIHEFAHKLDMVSNGGNANGCPALPSSMSRKAWVETFSAAYERLCRLDDAGIETILDPYATASPAEFFAVASETFFEAPMSLRADFPAVYAQLAAFYGLDTATGEEKLRGTRFTV